MEQPDDVDDFVQRKRVYMYILIHTSPSSFSFCPFFRFPSSFSRCVTLVRARGGSRETPFEPTPASSQGLLVAMATLDLGHPILYPHPS